MKRISLAFFLLMSLWSTDVHGDHLLGGELYYDHISGNSYEIELVLFADCASSSQALPGLYNSSPRIVLKTKSGANYFAYDSLLLAVQNPVGEEITPLCPAEINNSTCNNGTLPGIRKFVYKGIYNLPTPNPSQFSEWRFEFHGMQNANPGYTAGRSYLITNINSASGAPTVLNLRAYLNRSVGENSSPRFNSLPTPFYCINKPQTYNIGAVDTTADVLSYNLVPGLNNNALNTVNYASGYSGSAPLAVSSPISFSTVSGQLNFTPNLQQNSIVVYEVTEKRNGQIIGTSMREMVFVVISNCTNDAPVSNITGVSNVTVNNQTITGCAGSPMTANFNITDPNNNNISVSHYNLPQGVTLSIANNNSTNPSLTFSWPNPTPGTFVFYLELVDDGCPLAIRQTIAITVEVVNLTDPLVYVTSPTNCTHKATVQYEFPGISTNGPLDVTVRTQSGTVVHGYNNVTQFIIDSLSPGSYTIQSSKANAGCVSNMVPFDIVDSGTFQYPPAVVSPEYYCRNEAAHPLTANPNGPYAPTTIQWYSSTGAPLTATPTPSTSTVGVFTWYATQTYKVCESDSVPIQVYVTDPPGNTFSLPSPICQYDTILVRYNGSYGDSAGVDITWDFGPGIIVDSGRFGEVYVTFPVPGNFSVGIAAISEYGCDGSPRMRNIRVIPSTLTRIYGDTIVCQYQNLTVSNTQPTNPGTSYLWEAGPDATIVSQNPTNMVVNFSTPGDKYIKLTAASDSCTYENYHYVHVYKKPEISLNIDDNTELCLGDSVVMRVDPGNKIRFEPNIFVRQDPDSSHIYYLIILDATQFTLYAEGPGGCMDTAYVSVDNIKDCCNYFIPNAFSPNGDGNNDEFGIWFEGNPKNYKLRIFNRWGESIFSSLSKYDTWDGTYKGKEVDLGVYFYLLEGECYENDQKIQKSGDVTLIK